MEICLNFLVTKLHETQLNVQFFNMNMNLTWILKDTKRKLHNNWIVIGFNGFNWINKVLTTQTKKHIKQNLTEWGGWWFDLLLIQNFQTQFLIFQTPNQWNPPWSYLLNLWTEHIFNSAQVCILYTFQGYQKYLAHMGIYVKKLQN